MGTLTSVDAVKQQLNIGQHGKFNTVDDDLIGVYVQEASTAIETYCMRSFSGSVGTLFYDARYPVITSGRMLLFDSDVIGVNAVSNGVNGTIDPSNYRLLPLNYTPYYALQLLDKSGLTWQVGNDGYAQNAICVIGTTGYCATNQQPSDVTLAATKLAAWLYQNRNNDGSAVQTADLSTIIPAQAPQFVFKVLDKYVRKFSTSDPSHS